MNYYLSYVIHSFLHHQQMKRQQQMQSQRMTLDSEGSWSGHSSRDDSVLHSPTTNRSSDAPMSPSGAVYRDGMVVGPTYSRGRQLQSISDSIDGELDPRRNGGDSTLHKVSFSSSFGHFVYYFGPCMTLLGYILIFYLLFYFLFMRVYRAVHLKRKHRATPCPSKRRPGEGRIGYRMIRKSCKFGRKE